MKTSVIYTLLFLTTFLHAQNDFDYRWADSLFSEVQIGSIFSERDLIQQIKGEIPVVISAPHGGYLKPNDMKDRTKGRVNQDIKTLELSLSIINSIHKKFEKTPYAVINRIHRKKLDPNRDREAAAQGDSTAEKYWSIFHDYISASINEALDRFGYCLYFDIHAHKNKVDRIELGYLLDASILALPDSELNDEVFVEKSSYRLMTRHTGKSLAELIRGKTSFGQMLIEQGYETVPSKKIPSPITEDYFAGGFNTETHSVIKKGVIAAMQIETHFKGIRDSKENILNFGQKFSEILYNYMQLYFPEK
ncbi:MAG: hypothetical protein K9G57_02080 [Ignavibacteriales bacterium]|nr:hypothetical protein [Ignavibacteriales bacterium]